MFIPNLLKNITKRQKFVIAVFLLSSVFLITEFLGVIGIVIGFILAVVVNLVLFLILRSDIKGAFYYPIFILPFLYSLSFSLFYLLIPERFITRVAIGGIYAFGLYSLFLTQNIFGLSSTRTINLLRSARIVSFILTIFILFFLVNVIFSFGLNILFIPLLIFIVVFVLAFQLFWAYSLDRQMLKEILLHSAFISLSITQLSLVLVLWPVSATIYSIFITGIFYAYSGLFHNWFEKRLFKGVLWEYVWVGFLSILILLSFSKWGI